MLGAVVCLTAASVRVLVLSHRVAALSSQTRACITVRAPIRTLPSSPVTMASHASVVVRVHALGALLCGPAVGSRHTRTPLKQLLGTVLLVSEHLHTHTHTLMYTHTHFYTHTCTTCPLHTAHSNVHASSVAREPRMELLSLVRACVCVCVCVCVRHLSA